MQQLSLLEFQDIPSPQPAHVVAAAESVIDELSLTPPINANLVASSLDVSRIEVTDLDVAGCLICDGREVTIRVRASDGTARQRFTIFHECVHTFFRGFEQKTRYRCAPSALRTRGVDLEAMCDLGASSLLLPRKFLQADLFEANFGMRTLLDVAATYESSLEATGYRIVDLAPFPTLFVVLEVGLKPSQCGDFRATPKLRVRAARSKGGWPFVPRHKSVSPNSPLGRALRGEVVHEYATLNEITREPVPNVEVSARLVPFRDKERVLALYRRN